MSQKSEDFFSYSDLISSDIQHDLFQQMGSQEMNALLNGDLGNPVANGPYSNSIYEDDNTLSLEDMKVLVPFIPQPIPANEVLANEEYSGPHDFDVSVLPNYQKTKNHWVFSALLNKVYMDMNHQFPVDFKIKNRPNKQLYIRTTPQYSDQSNAGIAVSRCVQHGVKGDPTNQAVESHIHNHVIRCFNQQSHYVGIKSENQRLSIVFPLSTPQVGCDSVREMFMFVCKSSCPDPGMNRRPIDVIFTLEDDLGNVLGRKCLGVRVCACPKRDKEKDEKEFNNSTNPAPRGKKRKVDHSQSHAPAHPGKVLPQQPEDLTEYNINLKLHGKQNVLEIMNMAEKVFLAKAYQFRGHAEEQLMKKSYEEIQAIKRQLH